MRKGAGVPPFQVTFLDQTTRLVPPEHVVECARVTIVAYLLHPHWVLVRYGDDESIALMSYRELPGDSDEQVVPMKRVLCRDIARDDVFVQAWLLYEGGDQAVVCESHVDGTKYEHYRVLELGELVRLDLSSRFKSEPNLKKNEIVLWIRFDEEKHVYFQRVKVTKQGKNGRYNVFDVRETIPFWMMCPLEPHDEESAKIPSACGPAIRLFDSQLVFGGGECPPASTWIPSLHFDDKACNGRADASMEWRELFIESLSCWVSVLELFRMSDDSYAFYYCPWFTGALEPNVDSKMSLEDRAAGQYEWCETRALRVEEFRAADSTIEYIPGEPAEYLAFNNDFHWVWNKVTVEGRTQNSQISWNIDIQDKGRLTVPFWLLRSVQGDAKEPSKKRTKKKKK